MIVKLQPTLKSYLWGGTNLKTKWGKVSEQPTLSESWELSFHKDGPATIVGGEYDGQILSQVATRKDWGKACDKFEFFPVLSKIIDSAQALSIQVHPSDKYALEHEGQFGKTEMWYILDAEEGAFLYLGLNKDMTAEQFAKAIDDKTICDCLNKVYVKSGETYFIPSGTIHAIGAGITLFEIQQNSSLTYRVYDFDRVDVNGNHRELHVDKAKLVTNLNKYNVPNPKRNKTLGKCKYFVTRLGQGNGRIGRARSFTSVTVIDGQITVGQLHLDKGQTAFLSAGEHTEIVGNGKYVITFVK